MVRRHGRGDRRARTGGASLQSWQKPRGPAAEQMADNALVDVGWGRLIFAHTFDRIEDLVRTLEAEPEGKRDIAFYLRDPHVVLATAPDRLFLDPSHTYRIWMHNYRPAARTPQGFEIRRIRTREDAREFLRLAAAIPVRSVAARVAFDEAAEVAQQIDNPYRRTLALLATAAVVPDREQKQRLLGEALLHSRTVPAPAQRVLLLGRVAAGLLELEAEQAAETVLQEGYELAKELAPVEWSGFARGNFAETLALFDFEAALELAQELEDEQAFHRHHGNMAHKLAAVDPQKAEAVLELLLPLAELEPDYLHPLAGKTLARIAKGLSGTGLLRQRPEIRLEEK
jgi:hypothetical protein